MDDAGLRVAYCGFDGCRATILHADSIGTTIGYDPRVAVTDLRIVQERHQGALFATMAAAEHTETTLQWIAVTRIALNLTQFVAKRLTTSGDHVVVGIDD